MKIVFYLNVVSPHQLPLAREIALRVGMENFRYVYTEDVDRDHCGFKGWGAKIAGVESGSSEDSFWACCVQKSSSEVARAWVETADVMVSGLRDFDLFERRAMKGLTTFYHSERWFKPPLGALRLLHPRYLGFVRRIVKLSKEGAVTVLPFGVHAYRDFVQIGVPESAMILWAYFVAPSNFSSYERVASSPLRVMWCGRPLRLKRVDTVRRAVAYLQKVGVAVSLDVYTDLSLESVREEMRRHDVFVMASNAYEGWGAVVNEALEEGMVVLGTNQAGSSATILPMWQRFNCGDWRRLAELIAQVSRDSEKNPEGLPWMREIGEWTAAKAAERLLGLVKFKE